MKNYYISSKSTKRFTQAKRRDIPKFHVTQKDNNMDLNKYGFAIIGTGAIAAIHAKAIAEIPTATLVAVYNRTKAKAEAFAKTYDCKAYDSLDDLLEDPNNHIICICTASGVHLEAAEKSLRAGKHCLIEKPLEVTPDRCDSIISMARQKALKVGTIFPTRFYPNSIKIKEQLNQGCFGELVIGSAYVKWQRKPAYYQSAAWRGTWELDGGGALMNQGIHAVDMLLWYMGPAVHVSAITANRLHQEIEVEDTVIAQVLFKNGALGTIECSTAAYPGTEKRIEIIGTKGSAILEENNLRLWEFQDQEQEDLPKTMATVSGGVSDPMAIGHYAHQLLIEDFISAIDNNRAPSIDGEEGRKSVELICAIYQSAKEGKRIYL